MSLLKRVVTSRSFQKTVGIASAEWLRLVWMTNRVVLEPADIHEHVAPDLPVILAMWHGQHFLVPFIRGAAKAKVLVSRHRDGEINAITAERLGVGAIRGSGAHGGEYVRKGGVTAFGQMLAALADGFSLGLTADVPKISRVAGLGIVMLARASGRPILPVAITTQFCIELGNWDRTEINLPFGRSAAVAGELIRVSGDADEAALEQARRDVEDRLNAATARAREIVGRRPSKPRE
jgi:lysophospholipid acyltransferase (LPLAT)-like uncharacterized protein